ncbi:MAG TPA: SDR family NAD(P)-dependent oxidoreductase [Rhodococcus sp. (in: high G+C Gram-positive bacteria)]|uniref:SDR family NAD(P)-dependent oxidoreductase n=1 Tax=Rhodococcus sp. SJ-3 TaxID=3454628 RepID=UPI002DA2C9C4|nr:SDR family NAD(P)-dependent oxidoreductase [Rhodococcus sp. (in: high G+C Gram-positive bacteria)]
MESNLYGSGTTTDDVLPGVDLTGRTAVVTGVTSGLGGETARALASVGATVVLTARDEDGLGVVAEKIRVAVPGAQVHSVRLDLADLSSVRSAAEEIRAGHDAIDLLINNAGVMYTPFQRTRDGFELQFGTNHLGHFLLTRLLVPSLEAGAARSGVSSRVVTVSSDAHQASGVDFDDPHFERTDYDKFVAYARSKSANVLMTVELERRFGGRGVHAFAVHPGVCATSLARHMSRDDMAEMKRMSAGKPELLTNLKSIPAGAATSVWAATSPDLEAAGGSYLADCGIGRAEDHATDPAAAAALWELSVRCTA